MKRALHGDENITNKTRFRLVALEKLIKSQPSVSCSLVLYETLPQLFGKKVRETSSTRSVKNYYFAIKNYASSGLKVLIAVIVSVVENRKEVEKKEIARSKKFKQKLLESREKSLAKNRKFSEYSSTAFSRWFMRSLHPTWFHANLRKLRFREEEENKKIRINNSAEEQQQYHYQLIDL